MSDREILLRWLAKLAARLRWSRRLPVLAQFACALAALALLAEVLAALPVPSAVSAALAPLLLMAAVAFAAMFVWRLRRPTTLVQAAAAADTRAGLNDELKSAHWFAQPDYEAATSRGNALVDLLLARAVRTSQNLDVRRLFPLAVPRSALGALIMAVCTGALAWYSPRLALPVLAGGASDPAAVRSESVSVRTSIPSTLEGMVPGIPSPEAPPSTDRGASSPQVEPVTQPLPATSDEEKLRDALAARDAQLVAQRVQALQREQAAAAQEASVHAPPMPADLSQGGSEELQEAPKEGRTRPAPQSPEAAPTARIRQNLREQGREEKRKIEGTPAQGEVTLNPRLRAVNRNSVTTQQMATGVGQAAEAGTQTSVDGTPMGPREGKSRAGGSSGEDPQTHPTGDLEAEPVLGAQPTRLEVQLRQVRVERDAEPQQQAIEEEFYAQTQRQAARVEPAGIVAATRAQREASIPDASTPLAYREAVKRYFLTRHAREE